MRPVSSEITLELLDFLVKRKNENSNKSYSAIKNALHSFSIPFSYVMMTKGTPLFRIRVHSNYCDDLENAVFEDIRDVGHRYDYNNILNFGRANEPLQSIFYCSTERETAFFETSSIARLETDNEKEIYSTSRWIVQEDFPVATFPVNDLNRNKNRIAEDLSKHFDDLVKEFEEDGTVELLDLLDLLSTEFAREYTDDNGYLISCAFANYIYERPGVNFKTGEQLEMAGLMYPSVQWTESGMNLALIPDLVVNRIIELDQVVCQKMELVDDNLYKETETLISKSIDYDKWKINWK